MSGGHFNYAYHTITNFAEDLEVDLKPGLEGCLDIPKDIRKRLEDAVTFFKGASNMARDIELYFSGDYGDDSLRDSMKEWPA
jgi:hypothetical protein